jgi:hypothetical protein
MDEVPIFFLEMRREDGTMHLRLESSEPDSFKDNLGGPFGCLWGFGRVGRKMDGLCFEFLALGILYKVVIGSNPQKLAVTAEQAKETLIKCPDPNLPFAFRSILWH